MIALGLALALGPAAPASAIDPRVQAAAERAGAEAVVVVDVQSGAVLARAGAVTRPMAPGSTFKLVAILAAARRDPAALDLTVRCTGRARQSGRDVTCYKSDGHGPLTLEQAIPESCNVFFGALGERIGTRAMLDEARALGVGTTTGRLPAESAPAALVADGDGVLVTALEQAGLARQIALGRRANGGPIAPPESLARLRRGMRAAVEHGTGQAAASSPVAVAGKTGSAASGASSVGWFIGYAPADDPTVAFAIVRRGVMGHDTAKLAPPLLDSFFHGR